MKIEAVFKNVVALNVEHTIVAFNICAGEIIMLFERERLQAMPEFRRDGVELHYELEGNGLPVVLLSGFSLNSSDPGYSFLRYFPSGHLRKVRDGDRP